MSDTREIPLQPHSAFLSLSGEIRNIIYAYCVEDKKPAPTPFPTYAQQIDGSMFMSLRPVVLRNPTMFTSLAQVSMQIRKEYRPLYRENMEVQVWLNRVPAFLNAWYPVDEPDEVMAAYTGHIILLVPRNTTTHDWEHIPMLATLCERAPKLTIWSHAPSGYLPTLNVQTVMMHLPIVFHWSHKHCNSIESRGWWLSEFFAIHYRIDDWNYHTHAED
ncbi:hypothetical protein P3342_002236 [Pyrenophora teres f. teres]|nr:hypothetical protein P3342_002236 [Pyrenophora teres f. teres]